MFACDYLYMIPDADLVVVMDCTNNVVARYPQLKLPATHQTFLISNGVVLKRMIYNYNSFGEFAALHFSKDSAALFSL